GLQLARQFLAAATLLHPLPEVDVIVVLADVVDDGGVLRRKGFPADLLEALAIVLAARPSDLVAVVDVGLMMLVMMKLERLLGHVRAERVVGIRQFWELERHVDTPLRLCWGIELSHSVPRRRLQDKRAALPARRPPQPRDGLPCHRRAHFAAHAACPRGWPMR